MGGLLNLDNRPLARLLNSSMARVSNLKLSGVDPNCNKDIYMSQRVS